jgi:Predicted permeases
MEILGYFAVLFIGVVLGSIGSGGSMLAIPVLVYLFSMDIETASAYSLFVVGMTSLTGAVVKQKARLLSVQAAVMFGLPSVASTFIARRWIIVSLPQQIMQSGSFSLMKEDFLLALFSILMIASSVVMIINKRSDMQSSRMSASYHLIPSGFLVGLLAGLVGAGGGFLILPALVFFAGLSFTTAVGTTLIIIACNCLLGFCGDVFNHPIDWYFLLFITALAVLGLLVGSWSNEKLFQASSLQKAFAFFTMALGIFILVQQVTG